MNFEERLESIDTSLKMLVTIMQSAGVMTAAVQAETTDTQKTAETTATTEKKTRAKKDNSTNADPAAAMGLVDGDPQGTTYWVSESLKTVYAQTPGNPAPDDQSFKIETAAHYTTKKSEFAKKSSPATGEQTGANAKTPAQDTQGVSTASSGTPWESVMAQIKALNAGTAPGQGRDGVKSLLANFGLDGTEGKKVPDLAKLGKNEDILAFVNNLLNPAADSDDLGI